MQIDSRQLGELTDEVDELHHESTPSTRAGRRGFLGSAVLGGAALTVGSLAAPVGRLLPAAGAQSDDGGGGTEGGTGGDTGGETGSGSGGDTGNGGSSGGSGSGGATDEGDGGEGNAGGETSEDEGPAISADAEMAAIAAGFELAFVEVYNAALETGLLTTSTSEVLQSFGGHHQDHADTLNEIVGEEAAVTEANQSLLGEYRQRVQGAADEAALLQVLYELEEAATATHLESVGELEDVRDAGAFARILPVESQHAALLATLLEKPDTETLPEFLTTDAALDPADHPAS